MFNPFAPFSTPLLEAFIKAGNGYFVRQSFSRGKDHFEDTIKASFLLTHYREAGHAQHHYGAITHDARRYVYDWHDPDDRRKLIIAAGAPPGYKIYSSVFRTDWAKHITAPLMQKTRNYIEAELGWKPGRRHEVGFNIYVTYGQVYARLTLKDQEARIKLEDIEKLR
jgi:hypothetical protein